jgi:hypothetical protein
MAAVMVQSPTSSLHISRRSRLERKGRPFLQRSFVQLDGKRATLPWAGVGSQPAALEAAGMSKRLKRKSATSKRPKSKLGLPDLDQSKAAVLDSLRSPESKRGYRHACRNRHCPKCQTQARQRWLAAHEQEVLPTAYFHVVFSVPHELNVLALENPHCFYDRLFAAASATLLEVAANPKRFGAEIGIIAILHIFHALRLAPAAEAVHLFHRSRASGASLIVRPSPRPLKAPLTAQLRLSKAEPDATCEHQRNRAGEAVLVRGTNLRAGEHLLRNSSADTMDRFQTQVSLGGRKGE